MLTDREAHILDFEAHHRGHAGAKEEAVRATFGITFTRYYQVLNALIDREDAARADPMLVRVLREARKRRLDARRERRPGQ